MRAAEALESAGTRLDDRFAYGAEYLRTRDVELMGEDFIAQVRRRPLLSAGIAMGAGHLVGKAIAVSVPGRRRKKKGIGSQLSRAIVSSLATMVAARVSQSLQGAVDFDDFEPEPEPEPEPVRRTARKRRPAQ